MQQHPGEIPGLPGSGSSSPPGKEAAPRHPPASLIPELWGNAEQHMHDHLQGLGFFQPHSCWISTAPKDFPRSFFPDPRAPRTSPARPWWKWEPEHLDLPTAAAQTTKAKAFNCFWNQNKGTCTGFAAALRTLLPHISPQTS